MVDFAIQQCSLVFWNDEVDNNDYLRTLLFNCINFIQLLDQIYCSFLYKKDYQCCLAEPSTFWDLFAHLKSILVLAVNKLTKKKFRAILEIYPVFQ